MRVCVCVCVCVCVMDVDIKVISKFAQMEYKNAFGHGGSIDRGRTILEGIIANYPKRVDVWSMYLDMELSIAKKIHPTENQNQSGAREDASKAGIEFPELQASIRFVGGVSVLLLVVGSFDIRSCLNTVHGFHYF